MIKYTFINTKGNKFKNSKNMFVNGFMNQLFDESTLGAALMVGFYQGLKYKGSLVRGGIAGLAVASVISTVNGLKTIYVNKDLLDKDNVKVKVNRSNNDHVYH